jgi:hypothetical protein
MQVTVWPKSTCFFEPTAKVWKEAFEIQALGRTHEEIDFSTRSYFKI